LKWGGTKQERAVLGKRRGPPAGGSEGKKREKHVCI